MSKAASTTIQNIVSSHDQFYYFGKYADDKRVLDKIYSSPQSEYLTKSLAKRIGSRIEGTSFTERYLFSQRPFIL